MFRSIKQVGLSLKGPNIAIAGYGVIFPKDFRFRATEFSDIKRHEPIEYVAKSSKVLINTACALREFFLQTREYASDERGNFVITVVARLGLKEGDNV